jgi:hypothetical protein
MLLRAQSCLVLVGLGLLYCCCTLELQYCILLKCRHTCNVSDCGTVNQSQYRLIERLFLHYTNAAHVYLYLQTGTCACAEHRSGADCSAPLCASHDPLCKECTLAACISCLPGYRVAANNKRCVMLHYNCLHLQQCLFAQLRTVLILARCLFVLRC